MRLFLRLVIGWLILLVCFFIFGIPLLLEQLTTKTRRETYLTCMEQLVIQGGLSGNPAVFSPASAKSYCNCLSDPLLLTKRDVWDILRSRQPSGLTAQAQQLSSQCSGRPTSQPAAETIYIE